MGRDIILYDMTNLITFKTNSEKHKLKTYEHFLENFDNMILMKLYDLYCTNINLENDDVYRFEEAIGKIFFKCP